MLIIELVPDLDNCVETVAKREHATVLKQLLKPGQISKELEEKSEILRLFLETADFKQLRVASEQQLAEGEKVRLLINTKEANPKYEMLVT